MQSLKSYNTFGVDIRCSEITHITSTPQLESLCLDTKEDVVILGGGSNILFVADVPKVWHIDIKGTNIIKERDGYILLNVAAGESWHDLVTYTVENGYGGIENMALIPGKVGAAPMQNIGAYGRELKDVLISVSVVDRKTGRQLEFHASDCNLGYRSSNFKHEWRDKYIITSITIQLTKEGHHQLNTSYGTIGSKLEEKNIQNPTIKDIYEAVIAIRSSKLPNPAEIGNAGSFFKNPIISTEQFDKFIADHPTAPHYPIDDTQVKIPAGWLIDQAGWKGKTLGNVGCYKNQALVIVNHGNATGEEILAFSKQVQADVLTKFGIELEREINVV